MRKFLCAIIAMMNSLALAGPWPTDNISTTNINNPASSPSASRPDIATAMQRTKDVIGARNSASGVAPLDASALVPLANIPANLTGKSSDSVDGIDSTALVQTSGNQTVAGAKTFTSTPVVSAAAPAVKLDDTTAGAADFWVYADGGMFYLLTDRDVNGAWDTPHPLQINNANGVGQLYGASIWTTANDGAGSGLDADTVDGINSTSFARVDAATVFTQSVSSTRACAAGYTRQGTNYCLRDSIPSYTLLTREVCTTIAAPSATATAITLFGEAFANSANSIGSRSSSIVAYSDTACTTDTSPELAEAVAREQVATSGVVLGTDTGTATYRLPSPGASKYLKFFDDAGNQGEAAYAIIGYWDRD